MDPITAILSAASLAGAVFGQQRKHIDPNWLKQKFGAQAVSEEALTLFNNIINSPHGQAVLANAAEQGQQFQRNVAQQGAAAGLTGPGGASSGAGIFATSAAQGATDSFQRDIRGGFYQQALPVAQQIVGDRMQAYINDFQGGGVATPASNVWNKIGSAAGTIGSMLPQEGPQNVANTGMTGSLAPRLSNPIPGGESRMQAAIGQSQVPQFSKYNRFSPGGAVQTKLKRGMFN